MLFNPMLFLIVDFGGYQGLFGDKFVFMEYAKNSDISKLFSFLNKMHSQITQYAI